MNIPPGAILQSLDNADVAVTVVGIKTVKLGNEEMFLTSATTQVLGLDERVQIRLTGHWTYLGRPLLDIYNETYKPSDVEP